MQPGPGQGPHTVGSPPPDAQRISGLLMREPREVAELYQVGGLWIVTFQIAEGFV